VRQVQQVLHPVGDPAVGVPAPGLLDRRLRDVEAGRLEPEPGQELCICAEPAADHDGWPTGAVETDLLRPRRELGVGVLAVPRHRDLAGQPLGVQAVEPRGRLAVPDRLGGQLVGALVPVSSHGGTLGGCRFVTSDTDRRTAFPG
jgi:hypothetical protein